jgi:hypothetical protein
MTFLQPALLYAAPLAAIPVIIHLIHLYRRRQVKWAAMMFLLAAQRMNKGLSRLRQVLILALRVLALLALIFVVTRPLAGGWLGLTGGAPDTVLILVDRSASMEQSNPAASVSKRQAGLRNLAKAIDDAVGTRSRLVLIESALGKAQTLEKASALTDLPQTEPTDTAADIPALLQAGLDYITANKTGRTDVWLLSDLQRSDWDATGGRWEALRGAFATLQGVRFHLLSYPAQASDDLGIAVEKVSRRETNARAELLLDLRLRRRAEQAAPMEIPLRVVINGAATTAKLALKESESLLQAFSIPVDKATKRGWGRVELPADAFPANNAFYFVFDDPPVMQSVIVSDDEAESLPLKAALSAPADPNRKYAATVLGSRQAAEIPWEEAALIVWQAPLPKADEPLARQLQAHVEAGRSVLFLPPEQPDEARLFGLGWGRWEDSPRDKPFVVEWWRNDADLLANTQDATALPVGALEISRRCGIAGEGVPLARLEGHLPLLMRSSSTQAGRAYFLGTLTGPGASSLARDGVVMFALLHRALNEGARSLGKSQQRLASAGALAGDRAWQPVEPKRAESLADSLPLRAGVVSTGDRLIALNRPPGEDQPATLSNTDLQELFAGLDFRILTDSLENSRSLTNEVWRAFLLAMAAALVAEALLCLPSRKETPVESGSRARAAASPALQSVA